MSTEAVPDPWTMITSTADPKLLLPFTSSAAAPWIAVTVTLAWKERFDPEPPFPMTDRLPA